MSPSNENQLSSYTLPTDAPEAKRLDLQHEVFRLTFHGKLILAPPPSQPSAILDIGCGTSSWAIDVATMYPNAKVYGLDLGQPQPPRVPSNYTYLTGNFEQPWPFEDKTFDYIHGRFINIAMSKHKFVIAEALRCLKPGGHSEMQEYYLPGISSIETITTYWKLYVEVTASMGVDMQAPLSWSTWLREAGFENVQEEDFEWPVGPREGDTEPRMKTISELTMKNYISGIRGFLMGFLTRGAGWSEEKVDEYALQIGKALRDNPGQTILPLKVIWGQKPQ